MDIRVVLMGWNDEGWEKGIEKKTSGTPDVGKAQCQALRSEVNPARPSAAVD
jgi:hypothetical protein